jgi:hypothetical protein
VATIRGVDSLLAALLLAASAPGSALSQSAGGMPPPCERTQSAPMFSDAGATEEEVDALLGRPGPLRHGATLTIDARDR